MTKDQSPCERLLARIKSLQKQLLENNKSLKPTEKQLICDQIKILHDQWKQECAPRGKVIRKTKERDD